MSLNASQFIEILDAKFAAEGGQISFKKFMEIALYDSELGYYSTNIQTVGGRSADFSTWATLGNLGSGIAVWLWEEWLHHQWERGKLHVIEVGGGDGSLANQILKQLSWRTRRRLTYHIVDVSGPLREQQKARLKKFRNVQWHGDIESALQVANQQALIFSNELVDAFPANWFRWDGQQWQEVMVRFDKKSGLSEQFETTELSITAIQMPQLSTKINYREPCAATLNSN